MEWEGQIILIIVHLPDKFAGFSGRKLKYKGKATTSSTGLGTNRNGHLRIFISFFWVEGLFCDNTQFFAGLVGYGAVETGLSACVALACVHIDFQNQTILVAINKDLLDFLEMA